MPFLGQNFTTFGLFCLLFWPEIASIKILKFWTRAQNRSLLRNEVPFGLQG